MTYIFSCGNASSLFQNFMSAIPLIAVVLAIIGWFVTHWFAIRREKATELRRARAEYRAAISSSLIGLYPLRTVRSDDDFEFALRRAFPDLQIAIERYRRLLSKKNATKLNKAWLEYRSEGREIDVQEYNQYMDFGVGDGCLSGRDIFKANVKALLDLA